MLALRPPAQQMSAAPRDAEISGVSWLNGAGKQVVAAPPHLQNALMAAEDPCSW